MFSCTFQCFIVFTKKFKGDSTPHQAPSSVQTSASPQPSTLTQTFSTSEALLDSTSSQPSTSTWYQDTLSLPASTYSPSTVCLDDDLASLPTLPPASTLLSPRAQISTSHSAPTSSKADSLSDVSLGLSSSPKAKSKYFSRWCKS